MDWRLDLLNFFLDNLSIVASIIAVVAALFSARRQVMTARRATAITIAKNHYRETLALFLRHHDIVFLGVKESSYQELANNVKLFRRYRWLSSIALFSLQELHNVFVADPNGKDPYWERTIVIIASVFKYHYLNETHFPEYIKSGYNKAFMTFVTDNLIKNNHPSAALKISDFSI